jgi:hypothetical protein
VLALLTIVVLMVRGRLYATAQESYGRSQSSRLRIKWRSRGKEVRVVHTKKKTTLNKISRNIFKILCFVEVVICYTVIQHSNLYSICWFKK